jgi:hypothetical protein
MHPPPARAPRARPTTRPFLVAAALAGLIAAGAGGCHSGARRDAELERINARWDAHSDALAAEFDVRLAACDDGPDRGPCRDAAMQWSMDAVMRALRDRSADVDAHWDQRRAGL